MKHVRELILHLAKDLGKTIFLSSHLLHEVEQVCSRVGIINQGKLVAEGDVSSLLRAEAGLIELRVGDPERTVELLESIPDVKVVGREGDTLSVRVAPDLVPGLNRAIVEADIDLYSVTVKATSLEDFYLDLVHENSTDVTATVSPECEA
jgi:ABC-2 type transport system ATP-binding protein